MITLQAITQLLLSLTLILGSQELTDSQKIELSNQVIPQVEAYIKQETQLTLEKIVPEFVPDEYKKYIIEASNHSKIPVETLSKLFKAENMNNWDVNLRGTADKDDVGITQLSPIAIREITIKRGRYTGFFEQNFGEKFDITKPRHQILGAAVYLNYLKQFALPNEGVNNPELRDILLSYNLGAKGYSMVKLEGIDYRYLRYEKLLREYEVIN